MQQTYLDNVDAVVVVVVVMSFFTHLFVISFFFVAFIFRKMTKAFFTIPIFQASLAYYTQR